MVTCFESKVPSHSKSSGSRTVASAQGCWLLTNFCGILIQSWDMNLWVLCFRMLHPTNKKSSLFWRGVWHLHLREFHYGLCHACFAHVMQGQQPEKKLPRCCDASLFLHTCAGWNSSFECGVTKPEFMLQNWSAFCLCSGCSTVFFTG